MQMSDVAINRIRSIFHPTDFSEASMVAFEHALRVAVSNRSYFDILHVDSGNAGTPEEDFPEVRKTLERWRLIAKKESIVGRLHIAVRKVGLQSRKPVDAMVKYLEEDPSELVVLATQGRAGLPRWLKPSISEPLARRSAILTLFVPAGVRGFVASDRGDVRLQRVLIPVNHKPDPQVAIDRACAFFQAMDVTSVVVDTLYVGDRDGMPNVSPPNDLRCSFTSVCVPGQPADEIINAANERNIDLIVMATEGHKGFLDALRGSTTEQVLRRAPCPVLAVPAGTSRGN
jgi:nucleotide-binding universal stress UspA family protein